MELLIFRYILDTLYDPLLIYISVEIFCDYVHSGGVRFDFSTVYTISTYKRKKKKKVRQIRGEI